MSDMPLPSLSVSGGATKPCAVAPSDPKITIEVLIDGSEPRLSFRAITAPTSQSSVEPMPESAGVKLSPASTCPSLLQSLLPPAVLPETSSTNATFERPVEGTAPILTKPSTARSVVISTSSELPGDVISTFSVWPVDVWPLFGLTA